MGTSSLQSPQSPYNAVYRDGRNERIAYPLGGLGAGMIALEGTGGFSHVSLRHTPDVAHEPLMFAAVCIKGTEGATTARVLESQVPRWKVLGKTAPGFGGASNGHSGKHYGLPRFAASAFTARFPFGTVALSDPQLPITAAITGWSPLIPLQLDDSSLPAAALEYTFTNVANEPVELVFSFHAANFMSAGAKSHGTLPIEGGFVLHQPATEEKPWEEGTFVVRTNEPAVRVDHAWFRGGWFDPVTMVWNMVEAGESPANPPIAEGDPSPGGSLYVPLSLAPRESRTVKLQLSWYVPRTRLAAGQPADPVRAAGVKENAPYEADHFYVPWYARRFADVREAAGHWSREYDRLRAESAVFADTLYGTTMPPELTEAVTANLAILKSPTILRQHDGRMWAWEGCHDKGGSCHGTCTHVWNYAQAIAHLFPELERGLRETEHHEGQDERGHQNFRVPLPISPATHGFHAASDGQLGGIMKVYREWRIGGDEEWLQRLWPKVKESLDFCIESWDPQHQGVLVEPHHNTYDIEFWGADGMCSSVYLGALKAAARMANAQGEAETAAAYETLYQRGRTYLETELFNGDYFDQHVVWEGLRAPAPTEGEQFWNAGYSPEALELLRREGPKYQYGKGCLSDGLFGAWLAEMCGLGDILDRDKVRRHLLSVYKYNLKRDLSAHANPQRPGYAFGREGGLLLCTWPKGGQLSLPFVYSNEVWTGIEYEVASHLIANGCVEEGLDIVRVCRDRYDGSDRNPFDEYECGHWYARALASYGLIQAWSGIRYDAFERTLYIKPQADGDFRSFLSTAAGYGIAGIRDGEPFVETTAGRIEVDRIIFG